MGLMVVPERNGHCVIPNSVLVEHPGIQWLRAGCQPVLRELVEYYSDGKDFLTVLKCQVIRACIQLMLTEKRHGETRRATMLREDLVNDDLLGAFPDALMKAGAIITVYGDRLAEVVGVE